MVNDKQILRTAIRKAREQVSATMPASDYCQVLSQKLLPLLKPDDIIAGYWPIGSELDCRPLLHILDLKGYCVCLPRVQDGQKVLTFHLWRSGDPLTKDDMKILAATGSVTMPTVILAPLLAFDKQYNRLGQGQGYYDHTLQHLRQQQLRLAVGLAFSCQEVAKVPVEQHDQRLDLVLTI